MKSSVVFLSLTGADFVSVLLQKAFSSHWYRWMPVEPVFGLY
jgi:hypothetical protein